MRAAAAWVCAAAGAAVFLFFGNATRGYIDTPSTVAWWVRQWLNPASETEHGWVILALAAWVFARNLRAARLPVPAEAEERGDAVAPALAMLAALALHAVGFVAQQTRLSILALLLFAWGVLALADRRWARAAAFPLGFLTFAIPVNVLDSLGFWLRLGVIDVSAALAHAAGLGVGRSGTQLFAPDGRYQYDVAAACSGVRSLMALLALSLLIGYLNFRAWWRRALGLALAVPLTFFGNVVRIVAIVGAAQLGGQRWGERAHDAMGPGVFAIVLGGVWVFSEWQRRRWPERAAASAAADVGGTVPEPARGGKRGRRGWLALAVAGCAAGEMVFLAQLGARTGGGAGVRLAAGGADPVALPAFLGTEWIGRRAEVTTVERTLLPADTGFSRRSYVSVADPAHAVFVSIVLSGRDRTSIHRPEICLVGQGWTLVDAQPHAFRGTRAGERVPATLLRTERTLPGGTRPAPALVAYWFVDGDTVVATQAERLWRDACNRVFRGRADRWAYVLMQADAADGEAAALARMQAVFDHVWPAVRAANPAAGDGGRARVRRKLELCAAGRSVPVP